MSGQIVKSSGQNETQAANSDAEPPPSALLLLFMSADTFLSVAKKEQHAQCNKQSSDINYKDHVSKNVR